MYRYLYIVFLKQNTEQIKLGTKTIAEFPDFQPLLPVEVKIQFNIARTRRPCLFFLFLLFL